MEKDAGRFYEIRSRLRRQLSRHHWTLGKPFTPIQEDAWALLNEVDQVIKIFGQMAKWLTPSRCSRKRRRPGQS